MKRNIVKIDEEKCTGCGLCIDACHENALDLVNGKARLVSESYCDGLGACLPECPAGAITIEQREAASFDEEAIAKRIGKDEDTSCGCEGHVQHEDAGCGCESTEVERLACGCPGAQARAIGRDADASAYVAPAQSEYAARVDRARPKSQLRQWPVQIKLVPPNASYLDNAHLLVAADCTAYAYATIHEDFMRNKVTLIGCPKLDDTDYSERLAQILAAHSVRSITVLRMEVPCCGGLVAMVKKALVSSGKMIPWRVIVITAEGETLEE